MDYGSNVTADVGSKTVSPRNESTTTEESAKTMCSESSGEPLSAINTGTSKNIAGDNLIVDCKIHKKKGCRTDNGDELIRAWKVGNVLILHDNGSLVSYTDAMTICTDARALNKISEISQAEFENLKKSPSRMLRSRSRK